jgi:hypothetical protein
VSDSHLDSDFVGRITPGAFGGIEANHGEAIMSDF